MVLIVALTGCDRSMRDSIKKMNQGVDQYNQGNLSAAEESLEDATSAAKENHQAWYTLGQVRKAQKKTEGAIEAFSNAVKYKDDDPMYHMLLAEAYLEAKTPNLSTAQKHLERAIELEPRLYRAQYLLGDVHDQRGNAQQAAERWTQAAKMAPTSFGMPFNALGKLYIRWDFLNEAVAVLKAGIAKVTDPEQAAELHYHLGLALSGQNKNQEAVDAYTKAIELRKGNLDALRQRGYAYLALGDKEKAKVDLKTFEKSGSGSLFEIQTVKQTLFRIDTGTP
jgi:tetratricopeptide (TPR) repeat protein